MSKPPENIKVAVAQLAPVFLNREATIDKGCKAIAEAGAKGARLIVFPEALVPGYPDWVWSVPAGRPDVLDDLYSRLLENAVTIPSQATDKLCAAAREANVYVSIGMNEVNAEASGGSLYSSMLYIDDSGQILGKHRKLVPTAAERLVWAQGDGSTLDVYDTELGRLGGLICWENYMPLARFALYARGVQIYVATTWDRSATWLVTVRHIAKEGRMYVISCCMSLRKSDLPADLREQFYAEAPEWINVGNSAVANPEGELIVGPVSGKEEILYADIDLAPLRGAKWMLDVAGHYARPDVFELIVHTEPREMLEVAEPLESLVKTAADGRL